jgi:hypothetical protein
MTECDAADRAWQGGLYRASRRGALYREWLRTDGAPDEQRALLAWAMRSTLDDCWRLGVEAQARARCMDCRLAHSQWTPWPGTTELGVTAIACRALRQQLPPLSSTLLGEQNRRWHSSRPSYAPDAPHTTLRPVPPRRLARPRP